MLKSNWEKKETGKYKHKNKYQKSIHKIGFLKQIINFDFVFAIDKLNISNVI